jgi:hypothetical protein
MLGKMFTALRTGKHRAEAMTIIQADFGVKSNTQECKDYLEKISQKDAQDGIGMGNAHEYAVRYFRFYLRQRLDENHQFNGADKHFLNEKVALARRMHQANLFDEVWLTMLLDVAAEVEERINS